MTQKTESFSYTYRSAENEEVRAIREKYLPRAESGMEELKRLDSLVQNAGTTESLCAGISGALIFGVGMCLALHAIGTGWISTVMGIFLGVAGMVGMAVAYPIRLKRFRRAKDTYAPRILALTDMLCSRDSERGK